MPAFIPFVFTLLTFIHIPQILPTSQTQVSSVTKDGVPCTLCYSCENPCQPLPPPPPPPPAPPKCPPPPTNDCSPCQQAPPLRTLPQFSTPPPPVTVQPYPPRPPSGDGSFYGPPGYGIPNNPSPYFPYTPPMYNSAAFDSKLRCFDVVVFSLACVFFF